MRTGMGNDSGTGKVTNADIFAEVAKLKQSMGELGESVQHTAKRVDVLEQRWDWLTDTLGRLLGRQGEIAERTQLLLQRSERDEELARETRRDILHDIATIGRKLDERPCLITGKCAVDPEPGR
jgi:hypothetical protein